MCVDVDVDVGVNVALSICLCHYFKLYVELKSCTHYSLSVSLASKLFERACPFVSVLVELIVVINIS